MSGLAPNLATAKVESAAPHPTREPTACVYRVSAVDAREATMRDDLDDFLAARWSSLYRLACLLTGSPTEADDLLQESLVKVYVRWAKVSRTQVPEAYVRRIMVNTLVSRTRRPHRRHEQLSGQVAAMPVVSPEEAVLERAQVWPMVRALPVRQRAVIVLRYYEDLSEREIADVLGCSTGSVKSQAHDALMSLRRDVAALEKAEGEASKS
jgi:RNA polymerase sigma-70 factor (sigma-E family)